MCLSVFKLHLFKIPHANEHTNMKEELNLQSIEFPAAANHYRFIIALYESFPAKSETQIFYVSGRTQCWDAARL